MEHQIDQSGMQQVTVATVATDTATSFKTYWMVGKNRQGIINTSMADTAFTPHDARIAAELYVLQHLLENRNVAGTDRAGNGLRLTVSAGAIKKLKTYEIAKAVNDQHRRVSADKLDLLPYATFLRLRFYDAVIEVNQKYDWVKPRAQNDIEDLVITQPLAARFHINGVGNVFATSHVLDKFYVKNNSSSGSIAWRHLRNLLSDYDTKRVTPRNQDIQHARELKHGFAAEYYRNKRLGWTFVVANNNEIRTIVTAYPLSMM